MKTHLLHIIFCFVGLYLNAQQEFHVFPKDHQITPGSELGNGSLETPWDLQTALNQKAEIVKSGDMIWLHKGIYNGRFVSRLQSLPNTYITVSAYKNDTVVLNGNVESRKESVLEIRGARVIFKNFTVTFLGDFSRLETDADFQRVDGVNHLTGTGCKFINIKIYNTTGSGFGSWKKTGNSEILDCQIYNNGYTTKNGKGAGVGIYVQNSSNENRIIENNIIFNNFYKGIQVWSANKKSNEEYVKNVILKNNAVFNNGSPVGLFKDNLIIASDDRNGINIAKNIQVLNNFFYHNTNVSNSQINGDAAVLTLGFNKNAPIDNVIVKDNYIIGRNNALRVLYAKSLTFQNNVSYSGYVVLDASVKAHIANWDFKKNTYFTKKGNAFRVINDKDYKIQNWQSEFNLDANSTWSSIKNFKASFSSITPFIDKKYTYKIVLFEEQNSLVSIDFSEKSISIGQNYKIYDAENSGVVLKSGQMTENGVITFPMNNSNFQKPLHNVKAKKTLSNFGVFIIEFQKEEPVKSQAEKKENAFKRFFKWLGF